MLCENCQKKDAVIHIQEIVNDAKKVIHLCGECAGANGVLQIQVEGAGIDLADVLSDLTAKAFGGEDATAEKAAEEPTATCPACGLTDVAFRKVGRLGCEHCYEAFAEILTQAFAEMHRGREHVGKSPGQNVQVADSTGVEPDLPSLLRELERAVASEAYERAAELRDEIGCLAASEKGV